MASFIVWDMSTKAEGVWKTVEAETARAAAETICGTRLRSVGSDAEICVRVRSLDEPDAPAATFYGQKHGAAARDSKKREAAQHELRTLLQAAE